MGVSSCCKKEEEKIEDIDNCKDISEIRNYIATKIENADLEKEEINSYFDDKTLIPTTVEVSGFTDEDLKKRLLYLDEMKNILNQIDDLLKKHPNVDLNDIKHSLKEFHKMYSWIYDDSKRYIEWFNIFQKYMESQPEVKKDTLK